MAVPWWLINMQTPPFNTRPLALPIGQVGLLLLNGIGTNRLSSGGYMSTSLGWSVTVFANSVDVGCSAHWLNSSHLEWRERHDIWASSTSSSSLIPCTPLGIVLLITLFFNPSEYHRFHILSQHLSMSMSSQDQYNSVI